MILKDYRLYIFNYHAKSNYMTISYVMVENLVSDYHLCCVEQPSCFVYMLFL